MLGESIYKLRKQKKLTLSELAKRAKISKSYLSSIERNINLNPSLQVVKRISNVLDVELDTILNLEKRNQQHKIDPYLIELAKELKETGVSKEEMKDYRTIIEFIRWKKQKFMSRNSEVNNEFYK